jgi:hypothetical protein
MKAQPVTFRPPVSLGTARAVIAAALDDEGDAFATVTAGSRPQVWAVLSGDGSMDVYVDPHAIVARPFPREEAKP